MQTTYRRRDWRRVIDQHRNNLLQKTGARNAAGLVVFAVQNKLFDVYLS